MDNILQMIVEHKRQLVTNSRDITRLEPTNKSFKEALVKPQFGFIMECKKASPSKGLIRPEFDLAEILPVYNQYADAISVLTEERFFKGSYSNLRYVSENTDKPVLCKDFILEPKQVRQARYYGADAILLMLSVLNDFEYQACLEQANKLNMDVLTEVHNKVELQRAIDLGSEIIGINNRNLKNLSTSLDNTKQLASKVPADRVIITESGIYSHDDVLDLAPYADACLVGSSLMGSVDLKLAAQQLVYGDIKICGLTRQADLELVEQQPSSSLGVIFAEKSKRKVTAEKGCVLTADKKLIGVFQNQDIEFIAARVSEYQLTGIQLHGDETQEFIDQLRAKLGDRIFISKVIHVNGSLPEFDYQNVDEILLDSQIGSQQGGTGEAFDWQLLSEPQIKLQQTELKKKKLRIAGGVTADNIQRLKQLGFSRLDLCSGTEQSAGVKSPEKLQQIFDNAKILARYSK